jgi:hypothetical protein
MRIFQVVMRGLDPRIHRLGKTNLGEEDGSPGQPGDDTFSYRP